MDEFFTYPQLVSSEVQKEIEAGMQLLAGIDRPIVSFFGSARTHMSEHDYQHCERLAERFGRDGWAIECGGGPGIMRAASAGAKRANAISIGVYPTLLRAEQPDKKLFTHFLGLHYFFIRRFLLAAKSQALIFYPGGYGTLNELFEYVMLIQTGITKPVPIVLVNRGFWHGLLNWLRDPVLEKRMIDARDLHLLHFIDDEEEIFRLVTDHR
jgi:hypothetical protein